MSIVMVLLVVDHHLTPPPPLPPPVQQSILLLQLQVTVSLPSTAVQTSTVDQVIDSIVEITPTPEYAVDVMVT